MRFEDLSVVSKNTLRHSSFAHTAKIAKFGPQFLCASLVAQFCAKKSDIS